MKPIPGAKDRRPAVEVVLTTLNAGGKFGGGGYRISGGLHGVGVSVVNALSREARSSRSCATAARGRRPTRAARPPPSSMKGKPTTKTGTIVTFWPDPEIFVEGIEFDRKILAERLQEQSFLNKGIEIQLIDEREEPPVKQVFKATGGHRRLREVPRDRARRRSTARSSRPRRKARRTRRSSIALQWNERLLGVDPLVREHDQHPRGRDARGGPEEGAHERGEPVRAQQGAAEGEGGEPARRGRPRGTHRDRQRPAARAAVRGSDEDQARQRQRCARSSRRPSTSSSDDVARGAPGRREADRHEVLRGREGPDGGQAGTRPHPAQVVPRGRRAARASSRTASSPTRPRPSCSSSRATRPAARPSRRATRRPRRSCRSAARSSTSRRRGCTRSSRTRRSRRSSPRSARGSATRSSTSTRRAITRSC